jgi:hypothetical protein
MRAFILYLFIVAWCALWFCGCGGSTSVDIANSNQQEQNQTNDGDIQTAQEACLYCMESWENEGSLNSCMVSFGFDASDC